MIKTSLIIRNKIQENNKTLKELEGYHMKYMKKQEVCIVFLIILSSNDWYGAQSCYLS